MKVQQNQGAGKAREQYPPCQHERTQFHRHPYERRDGAHGEHIVEVCAQCGANVRGPGQWVSRAELVPRRIDPATPPILQRKATVREPSLFAEWGGPA